MQRSTEARSLGPRRRHHVRGRGDRRRARRRRRHRRGRVQHRAVRLPGGHHRPVLRRADHHLHLPAHRQLRRDRRPTTRRRGRSAAASSSATWPAAAATGAATTTSTRFLRRHGVPGIAGIDTRRLTRHIRDAGAMPGAFGTADEADAAGRPPPAEPGTDGVDLVATGHQRRAVHGRRRARAGSSPTTSASSARSCATSRELATVEVVPASTPRGRRAGPRARRRVPLERPRRPGRGRRTPSTPSASCSARCRCSASASATSCSAPRSAATTYKLPFGHHGGNHPVRDLATGAVEITSQNHNFAVADGSLRRRRGHPRQPQRRRRRGPPRAATCRAFSVQYHPEAGPGPHDAALPVRRRSTDARWTTPRADR